MRFATNHGVVTDRSLASSRTWDEARAIAGGGADSGEETGAPRGEARGGGSEAESEVLDARRFSALDAKWVGTTSTSRPSVRRPAAGDTWPPGPAGQASQLLPGCKREA